MQFCSLLSTAGTTFPFVSLNVRKAVFISEKENPNLLHTCASPYSGDISAGRLLLSKMSTALQKSLSDSGIKRADIESAKA